MMRSISVLVLTRWIFALFVGYGVVLVGASWMPQAGRLGRFYTWWCSLFPAVFALFWCFAAGFGVLVLIPASAPGDDAVAGVVEPAPLVAPQVGAPFVVGRVVIECLGDGRSYHVAETMAGPLHIDLRTGDGRTVRVAIPAVGPWWDSIEWQDQNRQDDLNFEDTAKVDSLDGVPGAEVALQRCPATTAIRPRWRVSTRALRPGDPIVVGHARDGRGPIVWRGDLAAIHEEHDLTPHRRWAGIITAGVFALAALGALRARRWFAAQMEHRPDPPR
jgi:hypothetical protein